MTPTQPLDALRAAAAAGDSQARTFLPMVEGWLGARVS